MTNILRNLLVLVIVAVASPALADEFEDTFNRGTALFKNKEYAKARGEYLRAYELRKDPSALFAVAQTYRYEGNFKEAIEWYKKFLADSQAAQDLRTEAEAYLKESENRQKAIDDANKVVAPPPKPEPPKPEPTKPEPPRTEVVRTRQIPLGSKIAAGVTGVGLVASILFTKRGLDKEKDLQNNPMATPDDAKDVESAQNLINISWGLTAAAAISTVVIYFVAPSYKTETRNLAIVPNRDGGFQAAFTARF
jgi:tetratricopeptide (TPR) repeat protein